MFLCSSFHNTNMVDTKRPVRDGFRTHCRKVLHRYQSFVTYSRPYTWVLQRWPNHPSDARPIPSARKSPEHPSTASYPRTIESFNSYLQMDWSSRFRFHSHHSEKAGGREKSGSTGSSGARVVNVDAGAGTVQRVLKRWERKPVLLGAILRVRMNSG
jgi:hypothetical protein